MTMPTAGQRTRDAHSAALTIGVAEMMTAGSVTAAATSAMHRPNMKGMHSMAKLSELDKAIQNIDSDIRILTLAREHLVKNQQKKQAIKKPRIVKAEEKTAS